MQQKIVITGGPGTGKTTVIKELTKRNFECISEISRQVTLDARKKGIDQLFLTEPLLFSEMLLKGRINQYINASKLNAKHVFFDRGIPDVQAYLDYVKTPYPSTYSEKSNAYKYSKVFVFPPWKDIYTSDEERYENYEESLKIYKYIKQTYQSLGYEIFEVPHGTVEQRTNFIIDLLN